MSSHRQIFIIIRFGKKSKLSITNGLLEENVALKQIIFKNNI